MKNTVLSAIVLAGAASSAFGAFTLNSGNATFTLSGTPFADSTLATGDFRPEGGTTTDHLFYYNWSYRAPGAGNRGFSFLDTPVVNVTGNTATLTYTNAGPNPVGFNRFNAVFTIVLTDGVNPGESRVDTTLVFTAASTNTGPTSWEIFNGQDFDFNGTASGDTYNVTNTSAVETLVTDPATSLFLISDGFGANRYEVNASSTLRTKLTGGGLNNLTNAGGPLTGDEAVAYQWSLVNLAPGASATIQSSFFVAPTPGTAGLLGVAGVAALRRRRA